jgi:hypothetical protein
MQLPIDRGMIIVLLVQPFFQELKPTAYLTNDDSTQPLLRPSFQLPTQGMDGRVPTSSYGSGNESLTPVATIFP